MPSFVIRYLPYMTVIKPLYFALAFIAYQNLSSIPFLIINTIPNLKQEVTDSIDEYNNLKDTNARLAASVERQNEAIRNINKQTAESKAKLQETIDNLSTRTTETIKYIKSEPIIDKSCEAAMDYLYNKAPDLK